MVDLDNLFSFKQNHGNDNDNATVSSLENAKLSSMNNDNVENGEGNISCSFVRNAIFSDFFKTNICTLTTLDDRTDGLFLRSTLSSTSNNNANQSINEKDHIFQVDLFEEYAIKTEMLSLISFDIGFDPEEEHLQCSTRRELVSPIINEKIRQGYRVQNMPCLKCKMPLMERDGVVDCLVCPILVNQSQQVEKAINMKRLQRLEKSFKDAEKAVKEAEEVLNYDVGKLEKLKSKREWLEKQLVILMESFKVAQEQANSSMKKSSDAHSKVLDAQKLFDHALAHANENREALSITKSDCKATLQLFIARLNVSMKKREEVNCKSTSSVAKAQNELDISKSRYSIAKVNGDNDWIDAVNAAQAVQLALIKHKEAEKLHDKAQERALILSNELQIKAKKLQDAVQQTQDNIEFFNNKVNLAIQHASTFEKQMEDKILQAQISKKEAEQKALSIDEGVQYKEVKVRVIERLVHVANENKVKVYKEYEELEKELVDTIKNDIPKGEEEISLSHIQLKKLISLESAVNITKLRPQLQCKT